MARRLSKNLRAKNTHIDALTRTASMPKLNSAGLEVRVARDVARKTSVRASLMVGTALSAGILAGLGGVMVDIRPAMAAQTCTVASGTTGAFLKYGSGLIANTNDVTCAVSVSNSTNSPGVVSVGGLAGAVSTNQGAATASVSVSNSGNLYHSFFGVGGLSFAGSPAFGPAKTETAGTATATTAIVNTGTIEYHAVDVGGGAVALADAGIAKFATGGTATAGVTITNSGTLSDAFIGIAGLSIASASAFGAEYAAGGTAIATTAITNSDPSITGVAIGIGGGAFAAADAGFAGSATGGNATAGVTIGNAAPISDAKLPTGIVGIVGISAASANAFFTATATGGTALATTSISNSGSITNFSLGIVGLALASANAASFGSATGGNATAGVTITNNAPITDSPVLVGIGGGAFASATAVAGLTPPMPIDPAGYNATGGNTSAGVAIGNTKTISNTAKAPGIAGILGLSVADSSAFSFKGSAFGGAGATANTSISNSGNISFMAIGIGGGALALSDGFGAINGTGGVATAGVTLTNSGQITDAFAGVLGISLASANGFGLTGDGTGGTATATTTISNSYSGKGYGISHVLVGIGGAAIASAVGGGAVTGQGGNASAGVAITNSANIGYAGAGIVGLSMANADGFGFIGLGGDGATATTSISNSGNMNFIGLGIVGAAGATADGFGFIGWGGDASAGVTISNSGTITSGFTSIGGFAFASASGFGVLGFGGGASVYDPITGKVVTYGSGATATTSISNSGALTSYFGNGISGGAVALANGFGFFLGEGGDASAGVTITNSTGGNITSGLTSISGFSFASASGIGFGAGLGGGASAFDPATATFFASGTGATATTTISNSANLTSYFGNGISGGAVALANGFGFFLGEGGDASAGVTITNGGTITSTFAGISGLAVASAVGAGAFGYGGGATVSVYNPATKKTYSTISGTGATATTSITNSGNITTGAAFFLNGPGILGGAIALAGGYGFLFGEGGVASAGVTINNSGDKIVSIYNSGIVGFSVASANGVGLFGTGFGGSAIATTSISNSATINSFLTGIVGTAFASAQGFGLFSGAGGFASAGVSITNDGNIKTPYFDGGIAGFALANATGIGFFGSGFGGTASATTFISNGGTITSLFNGFTFPFIGFVPAFPGEQFDAIDGGAVAIADGFGLFFGQGGIASATVTISNSGNLDSFGGGIGGFSFASAVGGGFPLFVGSGVGGTAGATTTIYNSGKILSSFRGIGGYAIAVANAYGAVGFGGGATAGTADATVTITNADGPGSITTTDPFSPGIVGFAGAFANAFGYAGAGGTASATTTVINGGSIKTLSKFSPGIVAGAVATAYGNLLDGTGGTAVAKTKVTNSGTITTYGFSSPGIVAFANADTGGDAGGSATAATVVSNSGTITTYGPGSPGIVALSSVFTFDALASTTVSNTSKGNIVTWGPGSPGVVASSYAYNTASGATATTTVDNAGGIVTHGPGSPGVVAYAGAVSVAGGAGGGKATVSVSNSGTILTTGLFSPAIAASVVTFGTTGSITVTNASGGQIIAAGFPYTAVAAVGADTTINNSGLIHGNVQLNVGFPGFVNTFNNNDLWVMQGNSDFGGNAKTAVNNAGTVTMVIPGSTPQASPDLATAGQLFHVVTLNDLQNFNNTGGSVSFTTSNYDTHERIVIGNGLNHQVYFNGTGASTLAVNAFLGGPGSSSDVLQIGKWTGQGYATGSTLVDVFNTNPGPGTYNPVGIPVIESGGANAAKGGNVAGNFTMPSILRGLFQYDLFYLPQNVAGNPCQVGFNCWYLASTPSTTAFELPRLMTAAQDIYRDASGLWLDRTADLRDYFFAQQAPVVTKEGPAPLPVGVGPGVWVRAFGDWASNNGTANWSTVGTPTTGTPLSHDVNYNQSTGGAQIGADFAALRAGYSALLVGVLGGVVDSNVKFASGASANFQGGNLGAYATWLNGNFFADALFLGNFMTLSFNGGPDVTGGLGLTANSDVSQYGGHIDTGYRFQFNPSWFFEPEATVEYVHTDFGNLSFPGASADLNNDAVFGRLGARIGTYWLYNGYLIEPSLTGGVWQTFTGTNTAILAGDGFALNLADPNQPRTMGDIGGMLNVIQMARGWSAFVKGDYYFANGYSEGTVNGGVRYQW